MPGGRPSGLTPQVATKIVELADKGKTLYEIADIIGVTSRTISRWQDENPELYQAIKEARQNADSVVEAALFHRAQGLSLPETKVFYDSKTGQIIKEEIRKYIPPDTAAAFIWLKNRRPKEWRDRLDINSQELTPEAKENILDQTSTLDDRLKELEAKKANG